jgi:hypothetical protein
MTGIPARGTLGLVHAAERVLLFTAALALRHRPNQPPRVFTVRELAARLGLTPAACLAALRTLRQTVENKGVYAALYAAVEPCPPDEIAAPGARLPFRTIIDAEVTWLLRPDAPLRMPCALVPLTSACYIAMDGEPAPARPPVQLPGTHS